MKSYNHIYEQIIDKKTLELAIHRVIKGRKHMKNLKRYAADLEATTKKAYIWVTNYYNIEHRPLEIYDGISRKKRTIIVPTFEELTVQHAVVLAMMPIFMKGMYEHSYASIPGRGSLLGRNFIKKWICNDTQNTRYVLKMDIRHFFESVPHDKLKAKFKKILHDKKALELVYKIIDVTEKGLPLGFFTSQWFSNWYLQGLDHYIKEELQAPHYIRYMDDMVIFGSDKNKLHEMREKIEQYLNEILGLELKKNWQVFRFDYIENGRHYGRDLDFMGFRFFRDRIKLRRSIMLKATRKAKRISRKEKISIYEIRQISSYIGWLDATDTYNMYLEYIKPYVDLQYCMRRISQYDRRKAGSTRKKRRRKRRKKR